MLVEEAGERDMARLKHLQLLVDPELQRASLAYARAPIEHHVVQMRVEEAVERDLR